MCCHLVPSDGSFSLLSGPQCRMHLLIFPSEQTGMQLKASIRPRGSDDYSELYPSRNKSSPLFNLSINPIHSRLNLQSATPNPGAKIQLSSQFIVQLCIHTQDTTFKYDGPPISHHKRSQSPKTHHYRTNAGVHLYCACHRSYHSECRIPYKMRHNRRLYHTLTRLTAPQLHLASNHATENHSSHQHPS